MNPVTDPDVLRQTVYATDEQLATREAIHAKYTVPGTDFRQWVVNRVQWRGDEHVLDLGCGPGRYAQNLYHRAPNITYYGLDFSYGMLARHPYVAHIAQADAQALPFAHNSFDLVMANILARPLMDLASDMAAHTAPGGIAILSGLLIGQAPRRAQSSRTRARTVAANSSRSSSRFSTTSRTIERSTRW